MTGHDPKAKLMVLGVFLLPLVLVKGTAIWVGQSPQDAAASGGAPASFDVGVVESFTPVWSSAQLAATHRAAELGENPFGESPLLHVRIRSEIERIKIIDPPSTITPPEVSVRIILHSRHGDVALIDRRRYSVGDAIGGDGWFIQEIDAVSRSVGIVHRESGKKATLVVPMPRGR